MNSYTVYHIMTKQDFEIFHEKIKKYINYPIPTYNEKNVIMPQSKFQTGYTEPIDHKLDSKLCIVPIAIKPINGKTFLESEIIDATKNKLTFDDIKSILPDSYFSE